jgi:hypothetical protein
MHTAPGVTLAELHKLMYPGLANVISILIQVAMRHPPASTVIHGYTHMERIYDACCVSALPFCCQQCLAEWCEERLAFKQAPLG